MSYDDSIQRRLTHQVVDAQKDMYQFAENSLSQPFNASDMYAFQYEMLDLSNANWASSQYTEYKHGISKAIIDAIN